MFLFVSQVSPHVSLVMFMFGSSFRPRVLLVLFMLGPKSSSRVGLVKVREGVNPEIFVQHDRVSSRLPADNDESRTTNIVILEFHLEI